MNELIAYILPVPMGGFILFAPRVVACKDTLPSLGALIMAPLRYLCRPVISMALFLFPRNGLHECCDAARTDRRRSWVSRAVLVTAAGTAGCREPAEHSFHDVIQLIGAAYYGRATHLCRTLPTWRRRS